MSEQQPVAQEQPAQEPLTVGFGKALMMFEPDWRNKLSADQVNAFRHFYNQGHQDTVLLLNVAEQEWMQRLRSSVQAVQHTIVTTGNEAAIEAARKQAEEAQQRAAEEAGEVQTSEPQAPKGKAKPAVKKAAPKQPAWPAAKAGKKSKK